MDTADIILHLRERGVAADVIRQVAAALQRRGGRNRDDAGFEARVEARRFYKRGRAQCIAKHALIERMVERFGVTPNVAEYLAEPRGYAAERAEADRRDQADPQS